MAKDMEDGSKAVGLFNTDQIGSAVTVAWEELGIKGPCRMRDLWRQKDLGIFESQYQAVVPRHGVALVRLFPISRSK
jgi:alpha-galactosidase